MNLRMSIRARGLKSAEPLLLVLGAAVATALGALVTKSPTEAAILLVAGTAIAIALTRPAILFMVGVLLLAVEPAKIFGENSTAGRPETFKLFLYACTVPLLLSRGIDRRRCAPLIGYVVVTILTEAFGTRLPGLTISQTAASLATLSLGWLVFAIRWDWRRDYRLLKALASVPVVSVVLGVTLQAMGVLPLFRDTSPPRLEGATIAAWLGAFGVCAVLACLVLYRRSHWKWAASLGVVNVVILVATLTRGGIVALIIVAIPSLVRFGRRQLSTNARSGLVKLGAALLVGLVGLAVAVPSLLERDENATVLVGDKGAHEIASGRFRAWTFAYEQAKVNLAFGRGVGAGPIVGRSPRSPVGFTAQHNEYVRMLLEVGIVGGVILLGTMVTTMISVVRRAPSQIRADLAAAGIALAIYSITENTLSATPIAVAFLLALGVAASNASLLHTAPQSAL